MKVDVRSYYHFSDLLIFKNSIQFENIKVVNRHCLTSYLVIFSLALQDVKFKFSTVSLEKCLGLMQIFGP